MARPVETKAFTLEEMGYSLFLALLAVVCVILAGKAWDWQLAVHAGVGAIFAAAGVFLIIKGYQSRLANPAQEIDGKPNYNMGPVKFAAIASMFWGIAGFLVGVYIASELAFPLLNFDLPFLNFGRLRPLHTSAVIFAFGGNALLATSFYVVQRTSQARMPGIVTPWFIVLGYNIFIVIAGTGYLMGVTQSKEYAEPEWYADLWLTIV